jgi:hypothetical protein
LRYLSEVLQVQTFPERSQAFATQTMMLDQTPTQVARLLWDQTPTQVARLLWQTYASNQIWTPFVLAGLLAAVALQAFNLLARRWEDINA